MKFGFFCREQLTINIILKYGFVSIILDFMVNYIALYFSRLNNDNFSQRWIIN